MIVFIRQKLAYYFNCFFKDYLSPISQIKEKVIMINQRFLNFSKQEPIYSADLILQDNT